VTAAVNARRRGAKIGVIDRFFRPIADMIRWDEPWDLEDDDRPCTPVRAS
jgi:hypothetical protein